MSSMPVGGVEDLGQTVEHGDCERVAEGVQQATLDDDPDYARPAVPQGRREGVGSGVPELDGGRAHPFGGPAATGPLPLKTREAVDVDTPARPATSRRVAGAPA